MKDVEELIRDVKIDRFKEQMIIELNHNSHKGNISEWVGLSEKIVDLEYHKAKMLLAIKTKNHPAVKEYIADCANILFSIGCELKLYNDRALDNGKEAIMLDELIRFVDAGSVPVKEFLTKKRT